MKTAQFVHIETYGKKSAKRAEKGGNHRSDVKQTTSGGVLAEARREQGFTSHIEQPAEPVLLYGVDVVEVEKLTEDYSLNSYTTDKNGKQKKLRSDASILLAGVVSIKQEDSEIWDEYKKDSIEFLKNKYGDNLKSVIEHTDESQPHIHFYVVGGIGEKLADLHDGKKAVSLLKDKKDQQIAYTTAMTEFQNDFYNSVSKKYGLDRLGKNPRKRMSREGYLKYLKEIEVVEGMKEKSINEYVSKNVELEHDYNTKKAVQDESFEKREKVFETALKKEKRKVMSIAIKNGEAQGIRKFEKENFFMKFKITGKFTKGIRDKYIKKYKAEAEDNEKNKKLLELEAKEQFKLKEKNQVLEKANSNLQADINNVFHHIADFNKTNDRKSFIGKMKYAYESVKNHLSRQDKELADIEKKALEREQQEKLKQEVSTKPEVAQAKEEPVKQRKLKT